MRWGKNARGAERPPAHLEIWGHLADSLRFWRVLAISCVVLAFGGLAAGTYGMLLATSRPLVFTVDPGGQAAPQGRVASLRGRADVEVRYVAKRFLKATMAFHSATVERDLADSHNLMTAELQAETRRQLDAYARDRKLSFAAFVKKQQIRTVLSFESIDIAGHRGKVWTVSVRGLARTWPLHRASEDAGVRVRGFEAELSLVRVPRTEDVPNGLLVSAQATRFYAAPSKAALKEGRVGAAPAPRKDGAK